jgi:hypothetical protein
MTLLPLRSVVLAAGVLGGILLGFLIVMSPTVVLAQTLPSGSAAVAPLRRGPDGHLEVVDPTKAVGPSGRSPCAPGTICVGPGLGYTTLTAAAAAARPGDVIEIVAGTYHESIVLKMPKLVVRGIGGKPHFDCGGLRVAQDKACLLLAGPDIVLENIEISGAEIGPSLGANAACVRNEPNFSFTLRKIVCHGSQNGVLTNGGTVVIEGSEFFDNGWTGNTHNIYLSGDCAKVTVRDSIFRDARVGHEFKSRCRETDIENSTFKATRASRALDLPDGGVVTIKRGSITQGAGVQNREMIGYSPESCKYPGSLTLERVQIIGNNPNGIIANFDKCPGGVIRLIHVDFQGTRPQFRGKVVVE